MPKLRVIVLSGFLGSGKTTFIKNIIEYAEDLRISIILNDISDFDMDVDLVKKSSIKFKKTKDMIEMGGGCVCCTLKDEMIRQVKKIAKSKKYDYLFIEATGISTPLPVAQAFHAHDSIMKLTQVYSMITVVDTENFLLNLVSDQKVEEETNRNKSQRRMMMTRRKKKAMEESEDLQKQEQPTLSELMIDQLEIANLIVLNKIDLVSNEQIQKIICYIKSISPNSEIIPTSYSKIDIKSILSVKRFDLKAAENDSRWITEKNKIEDIPQTIKYNISSFVYEVRRPFDPHKFYDLINHEKNYPFWSSITRAKGFFWLANYPRFAFTLQKAGARIYYQLDQPWWCQISKQFWGDTKEERFQSQQFIQRFWDEKVCDKRNQMVFISQDLDKATIEKKLNSCLIKEDQFENYEFIYSKIEDPFKNRWKQGIDFFDSQGILVENDGDWEEMDDEENEEMQQEY